VKTIQTGRVDLASQTESELAELKPHDRIDMQSFFWVVGSYSDISDQPLP
jgi:hypothetical protein